MLLLPFIMEYSGPPNSKPIQEKKNLQENLIFMTIYI